MVTIIACIIKRILRNAIDDTGKARKFVILDQNAKIQITASPWPSPNIPTRLYYTLY